MRKYLQFVLILAGYIAFVSPGYGESVSYDFCAKLDNMDNLTRNYTELRQELHQMCGMDISPEEQELGALSIEFVENFSAFSVSWKENEITAKEYAVRLDRNYQKINEMNISSSEIPSLIHSFYESKCDELRNELNIQDSEMTNITGSIAELEETQSFLTSRRESLNYKAEYARRIEQNLSRIYNQRASESDLFTSSLNLLTDEYEQGRTRIMAGILPYLFLGIVVGGTIGFVLGQKWKKDMHYWHAYSSSARVVSPLKYAAILTGVLLVAFVLYLFLSGTFAAIATY